MPGRLGFIYIKKSPLKIRVVDGKLDTTKMIVDWGATWKYWREKYGDKTKEEIKQIKDKKVIYFTNEHTDGNVMKWYWDRTMCNIPNRTIYRFKPVKANRLNLANWIRNKDRNNDYPIE